MTTPLTNPCSGIHKATIGQRVFWLECGLPRNHAGRHYNAKRNHYWDELFYFDEFDWLAKPKITKPRRKPGWATTRDILVKRGAKQDVLAQHREQQQWAFLQRPAPPVAEVVDDGNGYWGEW